MRQSDNTPSRMTALGLLEQMRRAGANREPEFDPVNMTLRERRMAAPLIPSVRRGLPAPAPAPAPAVAVAPAPAAVEVPARAPAREPVAAVVPRGEAPPAVLAGIAARRALDPNSPTYFEDIQRINNEVLRQTLPGMTPQPVVPNAARRTDVPGYARGGLADLDHKYADGGEVTEFEIAPVVAAAPLAGYQDGPGAGQMGRRVSRPARRAPRPAPREEMTADQLNAMVLDILASRNVAQEAANPASARERIRRTMGYAEGGLARLEQKYAEGGEVMSDEEYDRRLLSRMKRDTGRTTEPTREEQMQTLRTAGRSAVEGVADVMLPQSPLDFALMAAFGPGGRAARLAGTTALAALEPSEAEASRFRRLIRAYHASPYEFDTFDINKIGSGEGSQSYSNGFYFSENPALSGRGGQYDMKLQERFGRPANIYEVDIDSSPDRLIDWALPVSQQPGAVQDALRSLGSRVGDIPMYHALNRARWNEMHAGDLVGLDKATPSEVSARLRDAGVDGVRYLDIGTRGAGEGSQNYVIYRPEIIDITRRYAQGGLAQLDQKYAEGGEVSVMTYDPAAVDALANQIEAEYV